MAILLSSNNPKRNYPEGEGYVAPTLVEIATTVGVILVVFCILLFGRPSNGMA